MKEFHFIFIFTIIITISCNSSTSQQNQDKDPSLKNQHKEPTVSIQEYMYGKMIFAKYCSTCHTPPHIYETDQFLFDHLFQHLPTPSEEYFIRFIENSKGLEESDNYLNELKQVFNSNYIHHFKDSIKRNEFPSLIYYLKEAEQLKKIQSNKPKNESIIN